MDFRPRVDVRTLIGRRLYSTHTEDAEQMCLAGHAIRVSAGEIRITTSLGAIRKDYTPLPHPNAPVRRHYHDHTTPNVDRKTMPTFFYKARSGQMGHLRTITMNMDNRG